MGEGMEAHQFYVYLNTDSSDLPPLPPSLRG